MYSLTVRIYTGRRRGNGTVGQGALLNRDTPTYAQPYEYL